MSSNSRPSPQENPRILAIHPGALGDVLLFARLLAGLSRSVTLVTGASRGRLACGLGLACRSIDFESLPMYELFSPGAGTGGVSAAGPSRLAALLAGHDRLISCFPGDAAGQGRLTAACGCERAAFLPIRPPEDFRGHLLDLWGDLLGLAPRQPGPVEAWPVPQAWRDAADRLCPPPDDGRGRLVIHPGSGSESKCWPLERFIEVAEAVADLAACLFVLGPVEQDRWPAERLGILAERFPLLNNPSLEVLAGLLAESAGYLGNDSGVSHLAGAVGAPTTALFARSNPEHFAPLGPSVRCLRAERFEDLHAACVAAAVRENLDR
jgi:hypothetical protein